MSMPGTACELVTIQPMTGDVGRLTRQSIILFCGADMTGKTQIAQALSRETGIPYWKFESEWTAFKDDPALFARTVRYGDEYLTSFLRQTGASVIKDRGYPCEWVYSRAFGRASDDEAVWRADEQFAALGAMIVWCSRSSYDGISDDLFPGDLGPEKLAQIDGLYAQFAGATRCRVFRLNVDDEDLAREVMELREALQL